jgi:hypothetical protein
MAALLRSPFGRTCWRSARMSGARAFEDHVCALAGASAEA